VKGLPAQIFPAVMVVSVTGTMMLARSTVVKNGDTASRECLLIVNIIFGTALRGAAWTPFRSSIPLCLIFKQGTVFDGFALEAIG
jgi:hypothetical protein